ncbi:Hypothetical protein R9X50_00211900 [Acrodontium crateriforme]|uniref:FAS1 domain-containing protein n=1 Tax=Acrodontium crateriforme TaxID=150365 RepID=A0AAQ3M085_9PEZI|nr:Hypothetical protein R9X50_00211900 [Acrodontium crateriforme]
MRFSAFLSTSVAVASLAFAQTDTATMNLTALINSNQNLSELNSLLSAMPDLAAGIANMTNVTLFAPSNAAFSTLNSSNPGLLAGLVSSQNYIQALLSYHLVPNMSVMAANISSTPSFLPTALNATMYANVTGGQVIEARLGENMTAEIISGMKDVANITQADVKYNNGIVHIIDSLLSIPANVSATAEAADLTDFLGALRATNLTAPLNAASDITVFAPNNEAFQNISSALSTLTAEQITNILEYHVINGTIAYSSSLANASLPSMAGTNLTITVDKSTGAVFVNSARVINADILIANGVLHVLDNVLNPNNTANATSPDQPVFSGASGSASSTGDMLTSGIAAPSTTNTALVATDSTVAAGYTTRMGAGGSAASTGPLSTSSKGIGMPVATGAVGAAALFGGAAMVLNW